MRKISRTPVLFVAASFLAIASSAMAGDWQWDHPAGFKLDSAGGRSRYASTSSRYSYGNSATAVASQSSPSQAYRSFSYEPTATTFKGGDKIRATADGTTLMVGTQVVGTVRRGVQLTVSQIQGPWLWTSVTQDGRTVDGWIRAENVNLIK